MNSNEYQKIIDAAALSAHRPGAMADLAAAAGRAGVPLARATEFFRDDAGLERAVVEGQMRRLFAHLSRATARAGDLPLVQFRSLFCAYLEWMIDNPGGARVLLAPAVMRDFGDGVAARLSSSLNVLGEEMLARASQAGELPADADIARIMLAARALARGLACLQLNLPEGDGRSEAARRHLEALRGWLDCALAVRETPAERALARPAP